MTITRIDEGGKVTLKLDGWLDTVAAPQLGEAMDTVTEASELILDLETVEYIASSGIRQIVACYRKAREMGASFCVIHVAPEVMSIFEMTGMDRKIDIRPM